MVTCAPLMNTCASCRSVDRSGAVFLSLTTGGACCSTPFRTAIGLCQCTKKPEHWCSRCWRAGTLQFPACRGTWQRARRWCCWPCRFISRVLCATCWAHASLQTLGGYCLTARWCLRVALSHCLTPTIAPLPSRQRYRSAAPKGRTTRRWIRPRSWRRTR